MSLLEVLGTVGAIDNKKAARQSSENPDGTTGEIEITFEQEMSELAALGADPSFQHLVATDEKSLIGDGSSAPLETAPKQAAFHPISFEFEHSKEVPEVEVARLDGDLVGHNKVAVEGEAPVETPDVTLPNEAETPLNTGEEKRPRSSKPLINDHASEVPIFEDDLVGADGTERVYENTTPVATLVPSVQPPSTPKPSQTGVSIEAERGTNGFETRYSADSFIVNE